jgi:YHS domain-containing protein
MVKDPYCGVYFSRKDGVDLKIDGQDLYFCRNECRDKFVENHSKK